MSNNLSINFISEQKNWTIKRSSTETDKKDLVITKLINFMLLTHTHTHTHTQTATHTHTKETERNSDGSGERQWTKRDSRDIELNSNLYQQPVKNQLFCPKPNLKLFSTSSSTFNLNRNNISYKNRYNLFIKQSRCTYAYFDFLMEPVFLLSIRT